MVPPGFHLESEVQFGEIRIQVDPSESAGNGGNLVGMIPSPGQIWVGYH